MRLLQINIWQGRLNKNFLKLIEELNPDIITLQELCSSGDIENGFFNNLEEINAKFSYPYQLYSPTHRFQVMNYTVDFGNAILSKNVFRSTNTVFTNLQFKDNFDLKTDDYNIRNIVHAVIETSQGAVNVVTHHGYHVPGSKDGNEVTDKQMEMVLEYIKPLQDKVILTGDFNLHPESRSLQILNNELDNLCISRGIENTRNVFAGRNPEVCDYIFVNSLVKVQNFYVEEKVVSDHQALVLDFE